MFEKYFWKMLNVHLAKRKTPRRKFAYPLICISLVDRMPICGNVEIDPWSFSNNEPVDAMVACVIERTMEQS